MVFGEKLGAIQKRLEHNHLDGWLFYDFRHSNDIACEFLEIPPEVLLTRRFFYWIPKTGEPVKLVSQVEPHVLQHLPGSTRTYRSWQEFNSVVAEFLKGATRIVMEYSPKNELPYISKVDAGTMEMVRETGVEVLSSANLLQSFTSLWDAAKLEMHLAAADVLDKTAAKTWHYIANQLSRGERITDYDVQQFMLHELTQNNCISESPPICAVNACSADPHYSPNREKPVAINKNDFILIDLWCKQKLPGAVYADITRVGVAAAKATEKQQTIFQIVQRAQQQATELVRKCFAESIPLMGSEVDQVCRKVIEDAGYGAFFVHRTGHNIDMQDHGKGAHLDSLETQDNRLLLPGTCFSIEPGIYLPGEFGVRLEYDIFVHRLGWIQITGGIQNAIVTMDGLD